MPTTDDGWRRAPGGERPAGVLARERIHCCLVGRVGASCSRCTNETRGKRAPPTHRHGQAEASPGPWQTRVRRALGHTVWSQSAYLRDGHFGDWVDHDSLVVFVARVVANRRGRGERLEEAPQSARRGRAARRHRLRHERVLTGDGQLEDKWRARSPSTRCARAAPVHR